MTRISTLRPRAHRYVVMVPARSAEAAGEPIASSTTMDGAVGYLLLSRAARCIGALVIDRSEQRIVWPVGGGAS